jgi:Ca2+-binding EF-hand superfamily protein
VLRLEVWDFNSVRHDKFMGLADFKLSDLVEGEETQTELPLKEHEGKHKKETVSGTITIKATLKQDYHKQRAERAAKLEHDAELKRQEEELATKKQQEEDEKLISQVHLSHEGAMGLVRAFHKSAKEDTITRASLKSVFEGLDSLSQDAIIAQVGEPDTLFDFLDLNHDGELDLREVLFGISTLAMGSFDEKADLVFQTMDIDGNGIVSQAEFERHFQRINNSVRNYLKKGISEVVYRSYGVKLQNKDLDDLTDILMEQVKGVLNADKMKNAALTRERWREIVKEIPDAAELLICPQVTVKKMGPDLIDRVAALCKS